MRMWPAVVLVGIIWSLRGIPSILDGSMAAMMVQFMGPLVCAGLLILWWLFLSRAPWSQRLIGLIGLLVIGVGSSLLADKTTQGFGSLIYAIPWGATAFTLGLLVSGFMGLSTAIRTCWGLAFALLAFGYWSLIRIDAIRGDFETEMSWRWEPTAEDRFMEELSKRKSAAPAASGQVVALPDTPEWPAFRGPQRNGHQPGTILAENWSATPPKEIWRIPVGPGWSSFSVAGDRIFTQEQRGENEGTICYHANSGEEIWAYEYPSRFWEVIGGAGPRGTPTIDAGRIFALGANGDLHCLDALDGSEVWKRNIGKDADRDPPMWGFASSPLVTHGLVVVHAGGANSKGVLAYDQDTGEPRWEVAAGDHSYSSPQLSTVCGVTCILTLTNLELTLVDPVEGKLIGRHEWPFEQYRVVQPLVLDESNVLLGTAMGGGTRRIQLQQDGHQINCTETWTSRRMSPYYNDFVAHEGFLYGFDNNIFACLDLETGNRKWKKGRYGNGQVLLLPDGDQLLVISEDGELVLLRTDPQKLTELTRHRAFEGRTWNHPVLVGSQLYVRNAEEAACFEMPLQAGDSL